MSKYQEDFCQFRAGMVRGEGAFARWLPRFLSAVPVLVFVCLLCLVTPVRAEWDPELECLALNIYHEARGEPDVGKVAVGYVVLNRAADPRFPGGICEVVRQGGEWPQNRCQFSWWCDGRSDAPSNAQAWAQARQFAGLVIGGRSEDPTAGALWYHADYVQPSWGRKLKRGPTIGRHIFYRPVKPLVRVAALDGGPKLASGPKMVSVGASRTLAENPPSQPKGHRVAPGRNSSLQIYD